MSWAGLFFSVLGGLVVAAVVGLVVLVTGHQAFPDSLDDHDDLNPPGTV